jgi:hypothetical protein
VRTSPTKPDPLKIAGVVVAVLTTLLVALIVLTWWLAELYENGDLSDFIGLLATAVVFGYGAALWLFLVSRSRWERRDQK